MKKCKFCAEEIQDEAIVCKHCGKDVNLKKEKVAKKGFLGWCNRHPIIAVGICLFIVFSFLPSITPPIDQPNQVIEENNLSSTNTNTDIPEKVENWTTIEGKDSMTDKTTRSMYSISRNTLDLDFPYNGGSVGTLVLRNNGGEKDIIITVEPSQIQGDYNNPTILVRFDDNPVKTFGYSEPADYSTDKIFINDTATFLNNLKTAKKVMIEIGFYQNGNKTLEFNTEGFNYEEFIK